MAGLRIWFQFFGSITPLFWVKVSLFHLHHFSFFSFTSFVNGVTRDHQGSPRELPLGSLGFPWVPLGSLGFPWVPLGSLGFPQLNIIDFTNRRPKMAAFSLKTFRLFLIVFAFKLLAGNFSMLVQRKFDYSAAVASQGWNKLKGWQQMYIRNPMQFFFST